MSRVRVPLLAFLYVLSNILTKTMESSILSSLILMPIIGAVVLLFVPGKYTGIIKTGALIYFFISFYYFSLPLGCF